MTCYKRPSLSSVWSECMKGGVTVSVHHILTHSASTKITESHSASILTPTQPQSNLLSPPYQARLGLLDTTPNHTWHLGNVSFFTAYMILSVLTADCHIISLLVWYLRNSAQFHETWNWKVAPSFNFSVVLPAISMASGHIVQVARWGGKSLPQLPDQCTVA